MCSINEVIKVNNLIARQSANLSDKNDADVLKKMFYLCLASVPDPHDKLKNNTISIPKKEFYEYMGIDTQQDGTASKRYRKLFDKLIRKTWFSFGPDDGFISGYMFYSIDARGKTFKIKVHEEFLPALSELKGNYSKLLTKDITPLESRFSIALYSFMMTFSNKKEITFTTKQLKEIFGLKKDDYVSKRGKFERTRFEERTINLALDEIEKKCKSIVIIKQQNEKNELVNYTKIKENGRVKYYKIEYFITDPYQVLNQEKIANQERPRSNRHGNNRRNQKLGHLRIHEINSTLYNWLEE